jgi:hypothetical protein
MCQKAVGNFFAALTGVRRADHAWTRGQPGTFNSSELVERGFCRDCGSPLSFRYVDRDRISVTIGSLDRPGKVAVEDQYGVESRLPAFETLHLLPSEITEEGTPPERMAKLVSRQHPDHD